MRNAEITMALASNKEILTYINETMRYNSSSVTVNWANLIGLLPMGQQINNISDLLTSISFVNETSGSPSSYYQDTAQGQINVYGKLVRGHKMSSNKKDLYKNNDHMTIEYTVCQPSDLTRIARYNNVISRFTFGIYERDSVTLEYKHLCLNVDEDREAAYYVYN